MKIARLRWLSRLWLGTDPDQRLRLRQTSLAMALMAVCTPLLHYAVSIDRGADALLWAWTAVSLGGMLALYAVIRSGASHHFADPSLTAVQIAFALTSGAAGYAQAGPMRGAVFPVLTLILMFGMFQLRARQASLLCAYGLALFGAAMLTMSARRPDAYPPSVELGHFLMLAVMLPAVAVLTARLSRIRHRLSQQREDLARALAQLQAIATRDELTGLPNRRQVQALMEQELLRTGRHGHAFCIAMLDLDHFKRVNDQHGHAAGDAVLRAFASSGQAALRATDVLARWGGEEFVVLLPDTEMPLALVGMERLRQHIAAQHIDIGSGTRLHITVSIGLTAHRADEPVAQTLERADQLLYQAKHEGRDRTCAD